MGITGQGGLLWKSDTVKSKDIFTVVNNLYEENTNINNNRERPRIIIDANEVGYKFIPKGAAKYVIAIASSFADDGIDCGIVCDNEKIRHHSKRATISRKGGRARGEIQLSENRIELSSIILSNHVESI